MYTRNGCPFCVRFEREVAPVYSKTSEGKAAPLRRIELPAGGVRGGELREPVIATPTFVLLDDGREVGRITGYLNDDMFWGLLGRLVAVIETPDQIQRSSAEKQ
ncbi:thioredoxin family protein [Bosea sp. Root483D1]|uniref:thioredoxin family protein n=1 Tax=Bosea sp. Root483D1 TaxID=1736544 RepID=UPI001FCD13C3|nr:thioredoxin family protein [Bosea sp. Root483D1]